MKKTVLTTLLLFGLISLSQAQDYTNAIGIRFGYGYGGNGGAGVTFKHYINSNTAYEGILHVHNEGFMAVGLMEIHEAFGDTPGLYWFYGGGAHLGSYAYDSGNGIAIGVDGILGVEYNFLPELDLPINITLDWKPAFNLLEETAFWWDDFNLSIRYAW